LVCCTKKSLATLPFSDAFQLPPPGLYLPHLSLTNASIFPPSCLSLTI
jgi:hypothetical protein